MEKLRWMVIGLLMFLLAACSKSPSPAASKMDPAASSSISAASTLVPPQRADDIRAWRAFARSIDGGGDAHLQRGVRSYVVPSGDSSSAVNQRTEEANALRSVLEGREASGNAVVVTGPDSTKVAEVIHTALKDFPERQAYGLTIIFVGLPDAAEGIRAEVLRAGAVLQVRAMHPLL